MDKNCFLLKIDNEIIGNYKKLNRITFEVKDGSTLVITSSARVTFTLKAEGCTFSQKSFQIQDVTEYTYTTTTNYTYYNFIVKGDGKITVNNKYNLGFIIANVRNIDFSEFSTYRKDIKRVQITTEDATGNLDTIFENCSTDINKFIINLNHNKFIEGDLLKVLNFKELENLAFTRFNNNFNINNIKDLINLKSIAFFHSINFYGDIEQLASDLYNNGKTSGTISFQLANTPNIIVPDIISNRSQFYCTFSEDGYTFSQSNPNT